MLIKEVGLVCLSTGKELIHTLHRGMLPCEALEYCATAFVGYRSWLCFPPILKSGHVMIPYDYYIICMSLLEAKSLLGLHSLKEVPNFIKQPLRSRGLLDHENAITDAGRYVARAIKTNLYI